MLFERNEVLAPAVPFVVITPSYRQVVRVTYRARTADGAASLPCIMCGILAAPQIAWTSLRFRPRSVAHARCLAG